MEDHPGFDMMLKEAASKGFAIKYGNEARVALVHVVDDSGNVLEVRRELYLITGMRYLDLEHEMGHLHQLLRFGYVRLAERKVPPSILKEHANGLERWRKTAEAKGLGHAGGLTAWTKQFFHDIPALEARCRELGVVIAPKTSRW